VQNAVESGGVSGAIVQQTHGQQNGWQIQTKALTGAQTVALEKTLSGKLGVNSDDISATTVGPSWGSQISGKALEALIAFLVVIVIYLSIAFELRMAIAAFIALLHDLVIATGIYALAGFQVSPATVIGLLTILGYSLYDTVVVFDKVRENTAGLLGGARTTYSQAANLALNQTLVRSINTSIIALLPVTGILVVAIALLGANNELEELALVLFVGMLSGTYSSIFIATPVLADLKERQPQYQALAKRVAVRASGGRGAKRAAAKAEVAGRARSGGTGTELPPAQLAEDEQDQVGFADGVEGSEPAADELTDADRRNRILAAGKFIHANPSDPIHWGKGSVTVRQDSVFLESDFEVGPGPKFHVYLVPKAPIRTSGDLSGQMFVDLGRLRAFKGSQRYAIPAGLDLAKFQSVIIWCEQFSVLISPADLSSRLGAHSPSPYSSVGRGSG
jgi:preprotein translocase subunit SecF